MSMGGGGSAAPAPPDPMKTPPDPKVGQLPPPDGSIQGIQRRAAGQETEDAALLAYQRQQRALASNPSLIG